MVLLDLDGFPGQAILVAFGIHDDDLLYHSSDMLPAIGQPEISGQGGGYSKLCGTWGLDFPAGFKAVARRLCVA